MMPATAGSATAPRPSEHIVMPSCAPASISVSSRNPAQRVSGATVAVGRELLDARAPRGEQGELAGDEEAVRAPAGRRRDQCRGVEVDARRLGRRHGVASDRSDHHRSSDPLARSSSIVVDRSSSGSVDAQTRAVGSRSPRPPAPRSARRRRPRGHRPRGSVRAGRAPGRPPCRTSPSGRSKPVTRSISSVRDDASTEPDPRLESRRSRPGRSGRTRPRCRRRVPRRCPRASPRRPVRRTRR